MSARRLAVVTGGAGFIGSAFVHYLLRTHPECHAIVLDKLTYSGNRDNLRGADPTRHTFVEGDRKSTRLNSSHRT